MIETRADIVIMAHDLGRDMTDLERIALGATLIQTVLTPGYHGAVRLAAARIHEHAEALMDAQIDQNTHTGEGPATGKATTHEQTGSLRIPEAPPSGSSRAHSAPYSSRWGASWTRFRAAEAAFSNSFAGDLLGGVCIAILTIAALYAPLFLTL